MREGEEQNFAVLLAGIRLLQMKKWERQRVRFLAGSQTCPGCRARLVFEVVTPTGEWPRNDSQVCIFEESPHDDSSSGGKKGLLTAKERTVYKVLLRSFIFSLLQLSQTRTGIR